MRIKHRIVLQIGEDTALTQLVADRDMEQIVDAIEDTQPFGPYDLPASASNRLLLPIAAAQAGSPFGTEIRGIWLFADRAVDLRFNDVANAAIRVAPPTGTGLVATFHAFVTGVTQVFATNPSTANAVRLWGWFVGN